MPGTNDKKKVFGMSYNVGIAFLCVLGGLVLYAFYSNVLAGPPSVATTTTDTGRNTAAAPAIPLPGSSSGAEGVSRKPVSTQRRNTEEFNPPLHKKGTENQIDTAKVDPTLRLDLLAKVQAVELAGGTRNLFQFGPVPKPAELLKGPETKVKLIGPAPLPPPKVESPPPPPAAPPILLKYYGLSTVVRNGKKTAYFMDGDEIVIAGEGEMVKRRYRVIRIQATTVQVEDTEGKRTVTIPITEESQN
jgi:hypothetical protein